ncbi:MAG: cupredoxin domain-containing protein [Nitrososphaerota archaeon]|nr:cupredoxin domain-containing protein [Nitrososphaerota archaeon]
MARGISTPTAVGFVVSIIIIGAVASIGYYQFNVAPQMTSSSSTGTGTSVLCPSSACVNVTIPSGASTPPAGYASGQTTQFGYAPDSITVVIGKNNTVYFVNDDAGVHTATSDTAGAFNTGDIMPGSTAQITLTTPGTYTYHCIYHAWMQGTIVVKSA